MVLAILLAARQRRAHPTLTPAGEGCYSIYLPQRDGRLSWPRRLITRGQGIEPMAARSEVRRPNHCATETSSQAQQQLWDWNLSCYHCRYSNTNPVINIAIRFCWKLCTVPAQSEMLWCTNVRVLSFGAHAFRVAVPKIWNSIPLHIRQSQTYSSFRRHLKTYYFLSAHLAP